MTELLHTPLFDEHVALGARMVDYAGYAMPIQYSGIIEEHKATRESVGIFDVSHMTQFRVSGQGARDFLQYVLTNDLARIDETGSAQYTLMLNHDGGILDDLIVYNTGLEYLIIGNSANHKSDYTWLTSLEWEDVKIEDESHRTGMIALQGPRALEVIDELTEDAFQLPKKMSINQGSIDGIPVLIARTGYTGEDGVEIISRAQDSPAIWRVLLSFPQVNPIGIGARDTLRLEMGYHLYGSDMDVSRNPIEAGLGWVCPKSHEGYIGADIVTAARSQGIKEKLVHLRIEEGIARPGYNLIVDQAPVGTIASGSLSPTLGFGIATAYVPIERASIGRKMQVEIRKKTAWAHIVKPPFI